MNWEHRIPYGSGGGKFYLLHHRPPATMAAKLDYLSSDRSVSKTHVYYSTYSYS